MKIHAFFMSVSKIYKKSVSFILLSENLPNSLQQMQNRLAYESKGSAIVSSFAMSYFFICAKSRAAVPRFLSVISSLRNR